MRKKKKAKKSSNFQPDQKFVNDPQSNKNNILIFGGVLLAMSSISLLIFVLSEKVFHLS